MRKAVIATFFIAFVSACTPKIDASSTPALVASVAKVGATLNSAERERFTKAFIKVAFHGATEGDLVDLATHADQILPDARKAIDGKTGKQIIAEGGT